MKKLQLNKPLFLVLIIALLTAQWASAHIHLGAHHDHDGGHHKHASEGHAYHPSTHHADSIDAPHAPAEYDVVELEHECTPPNWNKPDDHPDASIPVVCLYVSLSPPGEVRLSDSVSQWPSWHSYAIARPRAPPLTAS